MTPIALIDSGGMSKHFASPTISGVALTYDTALPSCESLIEASALDDLVATYFGVVWGNLGVLCGGEGTAGGTFALRTVMSPEAASLSQSSTLLSPHSKFGRALFLAANGEQGTAPLSFLGAATDEDEAWYSAAGAIEPGLLETAAPLGMCGVVSLGAVAERDEAEEDLVTIFERFASLGLV